CSQRCANTPSMVWGLSLCESLPSTPAETSRPRRCLRRLGRLLDCPRGCPDAGGTKRSKARRSDCEPAGGIALGYCLQRIPPTIKADRPGALPMVLSHRVPPGPTAAVALCHRVGRRFSQKLCWH